jgi:hypothetical protein
MRMSSHAVRHPATTPETPTQSDSIPDAAARASGSSRVPAAGDEGQPCRPTPMAPSGGNGNSSYGSPAVLNRSISDGRLAYRVRSSRSRVVNAAVSFSHRAISCRSRRSWVAGRTLSAWRTWSVSPLPATSRPCALPAAPGGARGRRLAPPLAVPGPAPLPGPRHRLARPRPRPRQHHHQRPAPAHPRPAPGQRHRRPARHHRRPRPARRRSQPRTPHPRNKKGPTRTGPGIRARRALIPP